MPLKKTGQSLVEYALIIALVTLCIIVMGPYVIRAINAHFHILEEQVKDSQDDRLTHASLGPTDLPACSCTIDFNQGSCGTIKGKTLTCLENERYYYKVCTPANCNLNDMEKCTPDQECCTKPVRGPCGVVPRPIPFPTRVGAGTFVQHAACPGAVGTLGSTCDVNIPMYQPIQQNGIGNCYYGERQIKHRCGVDEDTIIGCITDTIGTTYDPRSGQTIGSSGGHVLDSNGNNVQDDDPDCSAICRGVMPQGIYPSLNNKPIAQFCVDSSNVADDRDVSQDMDISFIGSAQSLCTDGKKCEAICTPPFVQSTTGTNCQIQKSFIVAPTVDGYDGGKDAIVTRNDQSFSACAPAGVPITSATLTCGNPGTPGNNCKAIIK